MRKRKSDHELAEELANRLTNTPSGGRGPAFDAQILLQHAANAGGGGLRQQYLEQAQREIAKLDPSRYYSTIQHLQSQALALQGRGGDTRIAHVTVGEIVIPRHLQSTEFMAGFVRLARAHGIDPAQFQIGNPHNKINPQTGAPEFGIMDWMSGLFDDNSSQSAQQNPDNNSAQGAVEGTAARAAATGINSANVRANYIDQVQALDPYDNDGRSAIKAQERAASPPEIREPLNKFYPDLGANPGSVGRANVPNLGANAAGRMAGTLGRGLAGVNAAIAAADIATSDNPARTAVANAGAMGGGLLGGAVGAAGGGLLGPAAFVTAPAGAIVGSGLGGAYGYKGGEELYDYVHDLWNRQ